jgi:PAS domain S-box-containing protein
MTPPNTAPALRESGIEILGAVPWGTHFCQFYETKNDLIEMLVPYFRAGLLANEFCMWVTSRPLQVREARAALQRVVPDLDACFARGQIEILDYREWYTKGGTFDAGTVLAGWVQKLEDAQKKGFEGLRLTGNTFWLEAANWDDFTNYEATVNSVIGKYRMLAICTYSLKKCNSREILDVMVNHQFALIKQKGRWEIIENAEQRKTEKELQQTRERNAFLADLLEHSAQPFGVGNPDGTLGLVNAAFEHLTGYTREELQTVDWTTTLTPPEWREREQVQLEELVRTGNPVRYEKEYLRKDGTRVPVEMIVNVRTDGQGSSPIFYSFITDISRRKERERQVARLASFPEMNPNPVIEVDQNQEITYANPATSRIFPDLQESGLRHPFLSGLLPILERLRNGAPYEVQEVQVGDVWFEQVLYALPDGRGARIYSLDITARKNAEAELHRTAEALAATYEEQTAIGEELRQSNNELVTRQIALQESEQRYHSLFDTLTEGMALHEIVYDAHLIPVDYRILSVNPAFEAQTGIQRQDVEGKLASVAYGTGDAPYLKEYAEVAESGKTYSFSTFFAPMKRYFDISVHSPKKGMFATVFSDVTDRHRADMELRKKNEDLNMMNEELVAIQEELQQNVETLGKSERALQETSQYLESLIRYANAPIIVWDPQYRITRFNRAFERLTGRSAESVIGKSLHILFPPVNRGESMEKIHRASSGERWETVEIPIQNVDGEVRRVLWNSAAIYGADGVTVRSTIAQGQDITERTKAEEALNHTIAELKRSNQDLEQFAYIASHDLQEPLRNVTLFSQLFIRKFGDTLTDEGREYLDFVIEGSTRMSNLILDLLDYSRVSTRGEPFILVDMTDAVEDAVINLQALIQDSGAVVTLDPLPVVNADPIQIRQVYQNLIDNALKYRSASPPVVHISAARKDSEWIFSVQDNGIGIAPEYHEKIFMLFKRLHTRQKYSGTGIGLSLVKKIIERHGGRIWVNSEEGKGATFFFTLPA